MRVSPTELSRPVSFQNLRDYKILFSPAISAANSTLQNQNKVQRKINFSSEVYDLLKGKTYGNNVVKFSSDIISLFSKKEESFENIEKILNNYSNIKVLKARGEYRMIGDAAYANFCDYAKKGEDEFEVVLTQQCVILNPEMLHKDKRTMILALIHEFIHSCQENSRHGIIAWINNFMVKNNLKRDFQKIINPSHKAFHSLYNDLGIFVMKTGTLSEKDIKERIKILLRCNLKEIDIKKTPLNIFFLLKFTQLSAKCEREAYEVSQNICKSFLPEKIQTLNKDYAKIFSLTEQTVEEMIEEYKLQHFA